MNIKILPKSRSLSRYVATIPILEQISKSILCSKLQKIQHGTITIIDQDEVVKYGNSEEIQVTLNIKKTSFYSRTLFGGSIGNVESYVDNDWDCSNLTDLVRLFVKNRDILQTIDGSFINLLTPVQKIFHGMHSNTIEGSQKNIKSHYDMGNDFFKTFLDSKMMYSCALFDDHTSTLEEASLKKIQTICKKLVLKENDHLLEIGTGWGAVAIYAASQYGCKVTTTTISKEQFDYTKEKVKSHGLEEKITVLFEDYRNLTGLFDKVVSIEMIEAVGLNNLDTYFSTCSKLLQPNGLMVLQAITIKDQYFEVAKNSVDFIQRHIFPGSGIPSLSSMLNSVSNKTDMAMIHQEDFSEDYAQTLWHWSKKFSMKENDILNLGYPDFIIRLWQFYFSYCEGGFRERAIGLSQIVFAKPDYRNRRLA